MKTLAKTPAERIAGKKTVTSKTAKSKTVTNTSTTDRATTPRKTAQNSVRNAGRPQRGPGSRQPMRRSVPARNTPSPSHGVLWSRPGYLVRRLNQVHYALFFEECGDARMTPVQYGLLSALLKKTRGVDQNSLATEIGLDRTTTSDVLRRLEARGLVTRAKSATDKRMNIARLSLLGRRTTNGLVESMARAQERLLEPLPAAERERFMRDLVHLVESFDRIGLHVFKDV